ncbi:autotransporter domain-containing protein [Microbulbifer thermotolerans]|uniref:Autotransporter domain-containing protein n=1 Tax=Microbulbifer thermotolerans TaxID=252514 RepID=A0AB35HXZ7_MICTH|nr:autotransporter domain-containing protein [Microbulbifer thermotolerans]MCX2801318.1 autotransporter domain-containing protein [Microbulbifer thermotolerans]WKT61237.1 autotransporter domain-containing protein [Microbulbifer thermotolerans]
MGFSWKTLSIAVALAAAGPVVAADKLYNNIVVFGDSLSDSGNAGIFTSNDPDGLLPMQPAISFTAQDFGLASLKPSCSGLGFSVGGPVPCYPTAADAAGQLQQVVTSVLANGSNWAVGGNRTADVLLDLVGAHRFRQLFPDTTVADHNNLTTILPDSTRCGADGVCDPAAGESPYLSPAEVMEATAAFGDPVALQALVDDPNNNITLTGVPFGTGRGYLPQNGVSGDTLYFLNGGGNDIIAATLAGTVSPDSMKRSADFLATAASELRRAGAAFVVVSNVPRVGDTPLMNDLGADAVSTANIGTALFNDALRVRVNFIGNVLILDTEGITALAQAKPGLFGFADIDQAATCYAAGACDNPNPVYSETGSAPDSDRLLFNDGIHPTLAAAQLVGDYYYSVLSAPVGFAMLPDLGYQNSRLHQSNIDHHLVAQRFRDPTTTVFFSGAWQYTELGQGPAPNRNSNGWDGFFGFSFAAGDHFEWALALSYAGNDYTPPSLSLKARTVNFSALARWNDERWFVDGGLTYGDIDYHEVDRDIYLGQRFATRIEGGTDGDAVTLFARAGYDTAPALPCQLGPFIAGEWTQVDVDSFRESTNRDLTYVGNNGETLDPLGLYVRHQSRDYYRLRTGFFYNAPEEADWRWFGEVWLEYNSGDDTDKVGIGVKSIPGNSAYLAAYDSRHAGFFQNGFGALVGLNLTDKLQMSGNILVRPEDTVGGLNLNYRF